ncbi:MAG: zf-HC2 domain-containing protein [Nitrospirota bacterium]
MKDCKEVRKRLSAFIDNELPPPERDLIEKHLSQCRPCRQEEISLRNINELLDSMPDEKPAPAFTSMVVHRAVAWLRCEYVKNYLYRPAVAYVLSVVSLVFYFEAGAAKKRAYPAYRHLLNFDDFPPESLSGVYVAFIQGEHR